MLVLANEPEAVIVIELIAPHLARMIVARSMIALRRAP
jgi:hypothetical protein